MINTAALKKPQLINYLADNLGSSTICANVEAKKIKNDFSAIIISEEIILEKKLKTGYRRFKFVA